MTPMFPYNILLRLHQIENLRIYLYLHLQDKKLFKL